MRILSSSRLQLRSRGFASVPVKPLLTPVTFPSHNKLGPCTGYQTNSTHLRGSHKEAGVIVIQEWWGVNYQIQKLANHWFGCEFVTIVPDLYRGRVAVDHEEAGHLFSGLDWHGAIADIQSTAHYLKSQGCKRVGVVGFCMGGALSLASSVLIPEVSAAVVFYGIPSPSLADPSKACVPLQLHFGLNDDLKGFSDPEAQNELEKQLKSGNVSYEFNRYEGCGHAFANDARPEVYNVAAAGLARSRTLKFFSHTLRPDNNNDNSEYLAGFVPTGSSSPH